MRTRRTTTTATPGVIMRNAFRRGYRAVRRSPVALVLDTPMVDRMRGRLTATRVTEADAVMIVDEFKNDGVDVWLFGGWGCDALLGERTRKHGDLDVVIPEADEALAIATLSRLGFAVENRFETRPWFKFGIKVLDADARRSVTLHPVNIHDDGPASWRGSVLAAAHSMGFGGGDLFTVGQIAGHEVPCLSPAALLVLHTGYEHGRSDAHDVRVLCARFSLPLPPGYEPDRVDAAA